MPDKLGDKIRLQHVLDAITEISSFIKGIDYEEFVKNSLIKSACLNQLGVIGEACNRVSEDLKNENTDIPWSQIIGLRNILIHQYFGVDDQVIWEVIQNDLPDLEIKAKKIVEELN